VVRRNRHVSKTNRVGRISPYREKADNREFRLPQRATQNCKFGLHVRSLADVLLDLHTGLRRRPYSSANAGQSLPVKHLSRRIVSLSEEFVSSRNKGFSAC
jgi:predicted deacylase